MWHHDVLKQAIPAIKWGFKHEATALSAYLERFEETHRAVEVVRGHTLPDGITSEYPNVGNLVD